MSIETLGQEQELVKLYRELIAKNIEMSNIITVLNQKIQAIEKIVIYEDTASEEEKELINNIKTKLEGL